MRVNRCESYLYLIRSELGYLILGGDKTGDADWYTTFIPLAEKIYEKHLAEIGG